MREWWQDKLQEIRNDLVFLRGIALILAFWAIEVVRSFFGKVFLWGRDDPPCD